MADIIARIKKTPILNEYNNEYLKEYKFFLRKLLNEEKAREKLRKLYDECSPENKKRKAALRKKLKRHATGPIPRCFDYETAKKVVRAEGIMSLTQYRHWYKINNPVRMPKNPQRAYKNVWTTWGDFLGFYNEYTRRPGSKTSGRGKYRSFEDARQFAKSLNLNSRAQWIEYTRSGICPMDIPHRPDIVYCVGNRKEYWLSWRDFLGYGVQTTSEKIDQVSPIIYIAKKYSGVPSNVYLINVIPGGKTGLIDHIYKMQVELVRAYYVDIRFDSQEFIQSLSQYIYGEIDEFIISNIFEVIEFLDNSLQSVFSS